METIIKTKDLTKVYSGKVKALDSFSFNLKKGEVYSLLGPNGAGKTTLMRVLLSIILPTSGEASIGGFDISNPKSRSSIGYLSEKHAFPDFLTSSEVLYYYGMMNGRSKKYIKDKIDPLLSLVNLEKVKKVKVKKYSKGMLQRLGIAQTLIGDPEIIFLDEPTDGIDPVGRKEVRDIISRVKSEGKTIFINSHLLSEVEKISDRIAIMKNGSMIKEGVLSDFIFENDKVEIKCNADTDKFKNCLEPLGLQITDYTFDSTTETLNKAIDLLRKDGIEINEIIRSKTSLEDYFIKIIEE
ncbi:MAG: ABC transporter ATP-binding protein [Candidatus Cloacimonadota bacterium]|nr:MAG: ABC transporter ATP-binding protein [Candidatus Cloacimonadota bacterium]PIE77612.1 MAG: ABC transporter ATP-binding protein [Candidatus Delongbacteria bacterium]